MHNSIHPASWSILALVVSGALGSACNRDRDAKNDGHDEKAMTRATEPVEAPTPAAPPPANTSTAPRSPEPGMAKEQAEAELKSIDGQDLEGEIKFYDASPGVRIVANVEDAKPGRHGIHIHEKGDCSDIAGKSMGEHFAPAHHDHALPPEGSERHLGDLGNIEVNQEGNGHLEITIPDANLRPDDRMSFLGKAVVVHMGEDVGKSKQPSGNSGTPIACGVIEKG